MPQSTPTLFVPPTEPSGALPVSPLPGTAAAQTSAASVPTIVPKILVPTPTLSCTNNLTFVADVTVPDGTAVTAGQSVDKQWLVSNSGSCNWDGRYRLKWIGGDAMGAPAEQALYPARAGTQATLRIVFTAPKSGGTYQSVWQALAPDKSPFGETITMVVQIAMQ